MDERHAQLLCGLIGEYIQTGQPVSSRKLASIVRLDISSATIRSALGDLADAGYISQPHTSAGRIPTDKGYRYYVDQLASHLTLLQAQRLREHYLSLARAAQVQRALAQSLAQLTSAYAIAGRLPDGTVDQAGLSNVAKSDDDQPSSTMQEVSWFADHIHELLEQLSQEGAQTTVYIGEENPFFAGQHTSLIVRTTKQPNSARQVVAIVGPKRMPYGRNISLIEEISRLIA